MGRLVNVMDGCLGIFGGIGGQVFGFLLGGFV